MDTIIKVYSYGTAAYIFEVEKEDFTLPPSWLAQAVQKCYFPVNGSAGLLSKGKVSKANALTYRFPAAECRNPTKEELDLYDNADLV